MTGAQLLTYLKRRLRENGVAVEDSIERDAELYDLLTEARDDIRVALAMGAPKAVQEDLALEVNGSDDRIYAFPAATKDPLKVLQVRDVTNEEPLNPSGNLNYDNGDYKWDNIRQLRLADGVNPVGGVEVLVVLSQADITDSTTEAAIGLPVPCHRAIGKLAAVIDLASRNEKTDTLVGLFQREMEKIERLYGDYDDNSGAVLREALMASIGTLHGDTLY